MRFRTGCLSILLLLCGRAAYAEDPITFDNQVVRILQQHCQTCHRPGNIAPMSFLTYADVRPWARSIKSAVLTGQMPPWKPVDAHGIFKGERSLTAQEIQTLTAWVDGGSPEGNAADMPLQSTFSDTWSGGTPDVITQPSGAYGLQAGSSDIYRCFPMTIDTSSDLYVRGYEVIPGNRAIVHHVLLFIDSNGASDALDKADPGPGYTCFGGPGFLDTGLGGLGGWVPGSSPESFPLGTGVRIPKGSRIVMQVHYSLAQVPAGSPAPDSDITKLGIYLSPVPLQPISFLPVVNPIFRIPAGAENYQVKAFGFITTTQELIAITPHMHLLGRKAVIDAVFPNGTRQQLIRIDDWDFHWQGSYTYKDPILLPAGTRIELTSTYDNSINNPRNPANPPVAVSWGEMTTDEMCLAFLSVKAPSDPSINTVPFSITDRGTTSVATQGGGSGVQVGYARVSEASGNAVSGLAIFGYRQNGVLISEAAVPASRIISQGRFYAETSANVRSGLAIANPNSNPAVVSFKFRDESGADVYSGSMTIPANGQIAAFLNEAPFNGPASFSGSFTFNSLAGLAAVALRGTVNERSDFLLTTLPIAELASTVCTASLPSTCVTTGAPSARVFPHFADGGGWATQILLVNPSDAAISGTLRFADPSGLLISTMDYSIGAQSARRLTTGGTAATVRVGTVTIVPAANTLAPAGSLVFSYRNSNVRVTEAGVPVAAASTGFRVYVEASDAIQSGIAIANASSDPATVRLELMDLSGASISGTMISLAGNAQLSTFLTQIKGFEALSLPVQGLLRITSASPIAVTGLRSRTNERGDFLITTTPPIAESALTAADVYFPHFADGGGYTTQFIIFSSSSGGTFSGSVRFLSQSGEALNLKLR